mmetsp:Transcript_4742/g.8946  ORF Transcript_4742/g.8946 Transcript_4742/m.8946 type:complete len:168 (+) Transcript_4742:1-504(+)
MNSLLRFVFLAYFISHVPITLFIDLQGNWGPQYPAMLQQVNTWYCETYGDFLMADPPIWFRSFIMGEAFFQFPFFFVATYGLLYRKQWIRIPSIIYGSHVVTTLQPIMYTFYLADNSDGRMNKLALFGFYMPYLMVPLILTLYMSLNPEPFGVTGTGPRSTLHDKRK